jgi:S1-C subfamily serine protease
MYRRGLGVAKDPVRADQLERSASQFVGGTARPPAAVSPAPRTAGPSGSIAVRPAAPLAPQGQVASTGSGLVIDETGRVLTNYHVAKGCRSLRVGADGALRAARLAAYDPTTDLALLDVPGSKAPRPAVFRDNGTAELGEGVLLAGFPLQGVLSSDLHVASGMVSALAGPGGDRRLVQLSAPVHPGNSGGPVLDQRGQVIGVLSGTLDSGRIEQMTGLPAQSVGFAVRGDAVQRFLRKTGVPLRTGGSAKPLDSKELAARARRFTVLVQCLK